MDAARNMKKKKKKKKKILKTIPQKEGPRPPLMHTADLSPEYAVLRLPSSHGMGGSASCHGQDCRMHTPHYLQIYVISILRHDNVITKCEIAIFGIK
jgi:hypothetical protein